MRVWIDLLTPKQVLFFEPVIDMLKERGDEVIITSRRYREAELMARKREMNVEFIGEHGGKLLADKLHASVERTNLLTEKFRNNAPDIALNFSSPEAARVAFGLGISNVCVNDSPHATATCRLTVPLTDMLITPWIIPDAAWTQYGIEKTKIARYKALDPFMWIKRRDLVNIQSPDIGLDSKKATIVVRLEESFAAYMPVQTDVGYTVEFALLKRLVEEFRNYNIVVLCRYSEQIDTVLENFKGRIIVPRDLVDGVALLLSSHLFIGMGGTMTAEAALLGIPSISFFRGSYFIERYLISKGLLTKPRDIEGVMRVSKNFLRNERISKEMIARASKIRSGMEDPSKTIVKKLDNIIIEKLNRPQIDRR